MTSSADTARERAVKVLQVRSRIAGWNAERIEMWSGWAREHYLEVRRWRATLKREARDGGRLKILVERERTSFNAIKKATAAGVPLSEIRAYKERFLKLGRKGVWSYDDWWKFDQLISHHENSRSRWSA